MARTSWRCNCCAVNGFGLNLNMAATRQPAIRAKSSAALALPKPAGLGARMGDALMTLVATLPHSSEGASATPQTRALALTRAAARKSAGISGGAAMAPGPLGLLTLMPDLVAVWRVQSQLVADIGAVYGKDATLTREQMLHCLFKHTASHITRDLVMRAGERYLVQRGSAVALKALVGKLGLKLAQKTVGKAFARWAPVVGALGVGGYAYYDTKKVGANAIELFSCELVLHDPA